MSEFLWVEKYRPHSVADCILPERIKKVFQSYVDTKSIFDFELEARPVLQVLIGKALD